MTRLTSALTMTLAATVVCVGLAAPATAARGAGWTPAPRATQSAVVKAVNALAKKTGGVAHSPGCFSVLLLKGHSNLAAINLQSKANVQACGSAQEFGIQAFKKSGATWVHVGGTNGPAGSSCTFDKAATAGIKALLKSSGLCG
jgi:hypothetical protein